MVAATVPHIPVVGLVYNTATRDLEERNYLAFAQTYGQWGVCLVASRLLMSTSAKPKGKAPAGSLARLPMVEPATTCGNTGALDGGVTVGRASKCNETLGSNPFTSACHVRFFPRDENRYVADLGSTKGPLVNAYCITVSLLLCIDNRIQISSLAFEVH